MKKLMATVAAAAAITVAVHAAPSGTASSSVAGSRAHAIQTARSVPVNKTVRHLVAAGAVAATAIVGATVAAAQPTPTPIEAPAVVKAASADVGNVVAAQVATTTTTAAPATVTTPQRPAAAAATVQAAPAAMPDITGATAPGKDTNAPLVPGHWVQATNGQIYRDPSPYTQMPVGATDPAYEAGLDAKLCAVKPAFCQP